LLGHSGLRLQAAQLRFDRTLTGLNLDGVEVVEFERLLENKEVLGAVVAFERRWSRRNCARIEPAGGRTRERVTVAGKRNAEVLSFARELLNAA